MIDRLYWPSWIFAAFLTGIVGGFMLGHALILAQFLNWLLLSGVPALSQAYPAFRATAGRFVGWNVPIHLVHAAILTVALGALLSVPLASLRRRG